MDQGIDVIYEARFLEVSLALTLAQDTIIMEPKPQGIQHLATGYKLNRFGPSNLK
jgi:hypothetical protein